MTLAAAGRIRHPGGNIDEARQVLALGEIEYMRRARREAANWIQGNPTAFARLTTLRFFCLWFGPFTDPLAAAAVFPLTLLALLGARRLFPVLPLPGRAALLIPLAAYPLVYYLVPYFPRYRVPIDWIVLLLAGHALAAWFSTQPPPVQPNAMDPAGR